MKVFGAVQVSFVGVSADAEAQLCNCFAEVLP